METQAVEADACCGPGVKLFQLEVIHNISIGQIFP